MPSRPKSKRSTPLPVVIKNHKQVATRPVMLIVLGPHRSGTSLTARMLECLGAENSQNQLPTQPDNPTGFFEDSDVYAFGESVLLPKIQRRWDSVSPTDWSVLSKTDRSRLGLQALEIIRKNYPLSNPLSVLKEPRINNTLPFWLSLLEHAGFDVRFVCVIRDPVSTARSLEKRNHFSLAHGGMIYVSSWLSVLPHLQERKVSFVHFDEIFATPGKVLGKVADKLGLPLPSDFDQRLHEFTSTHLEPALRHNSLPREDVMLEPDLPPLVTELYRVLLDAAQSQNVSKTAKFVAYAERQIESLAPLLADYDAKQTRLASIQTESNAAKAECARLQSQLTDSSHQSHAVITAERDAVVAERETLRSRICALEAEHSELASRHQQLATVLEDLKGQQTSLLTERDTLAQERELIRSERDTLAQERSNLIVERDALATRLSSLESDHSSLSTTHSSLVAERDGLATALENLQGQNSSVAAERDALAQAQQETTAKIAELETSVQQAATERDALAARVSALESEHSDLVTRHTSLVTEREALKSDHYSLFTLHSSLVAERDELATRHSSLAAALEELQSQHSSLVAERDALATRVAALKSELTNGSYELRTNLLAERNTLSRTIKERDEAARERDHYAAKLIKLEREYHALAKSEHSLKISHRQSEERFARASAALALLKNAQDEATSLRTSLASLQAEKDRVAKDRDRLANHISTLEGEYSDLTTRHSSLVTSQECLVAERDGLETNLQSALQDSKALAENIATRFHELAILAKTIEERDAELQRVNQAASYRGANGCLIEKVSFADAREHPPHNHLNINLHNLQVGDTHWETLRIRLVEHHGRPGLAIFEPASGGAPLKKWSLSGEESRVPFYLLVPEDNNGRRLLDEASGADFSFLQFLVGTLEAELGKSSASPDLPAGRAATLQSWRQRATGLRQVFDRQSGAFFRHGKPRARLSPEGSMAKAVQVTVPDCYFDGRFFPIVEFTWKPKDSTLLFSAKDNPVPLFVGTEALRNWSAGSALEVCFEGNPKAADSVHKLPSAENDARLAKAIAQKLPALLLALPASLQRKARGLGRSLVGEKPVIFRRPAKSSRS